MHALVELLERKPVKWSPTPEQAESLENAFGGDNPYVPPDHGPTTNVPEQQEREPPAEISPAFIAIEKLRQDTEERLTGLKDLMYGKNPAGPPPSVPEQQEQPKLSETDRELVKLLSEPVIVTSEVAKLLDEFFAFQQEKDHIPGPVETLCHLWRQQTGQS